MKPTKEEELKKGCGKYIEERDNYCGLEKKDDFCFYSGSYDTLCPKCKKKLGGGE